MKATQRVHAHPRDPSQREPTPNSPTGTHRGTCHGLGNNWRTRQVGRSGAQIGRHTIRFDPADSAVQPDRVTDQHRRLTQGLTSPRRLPRHAFRLCTKMFDERGYSFTGRRRHREHRRSGHSTLRQETTQIPLNRIPLSRSDSVDVRQDNSHRRMGGAKTRQPLVMQPSVRVFLRVDDHHESIDAGREAIGNLSVAYLNRINIRKVDNNSVTGQCSRRFHPPRNSHPAEEFTGCTPRRKNSTGLARRRTTNASSNHLGPAQRVHQRGLASTRPTEHSDHAPRRIDLATLGGNVDQLTNPGQRRLIDVGGRQRADLVELCGCRRDRALRAPHARTSRAFANA